jgi:hypothetical protein
VPDVPLLVHDHAGDLGYGPVLAAVEGRALRSVDGEAESMGRRDQKDHETVGEPLGTL